MTILRRNSKTCWTLSQRASRRGAGILIKQIVAYACMSAAAITAVSSNLYALDSEDQIKWFTEEYPMCDFEHRMASYPDVYFSDEEFQELELLAFSERASIEDGDINSTEYLLSQFCLTTTNEVNKVFSRWKSEEYRKRSASSVLFWLAELGNAEDEREARAANAVIAQRFRSEVPSDCKAFAHWAVDYFAQCEGERAIRKAAAESDTQ